MRLGLSARRPGLVLLFCAAGLAPPAGALAQPAGPFSVGPGPAPEALIALALRGGVSLINPELCRGRTQGVRADTVQQAVARVARDAGCGFEVLDSRTIRMTPRPQPRPARPARAAEAPTVAEVIVTRPPDEPGAEFPPGATAVESRRLRSLDASDIAGLEAVVAGLMSTNLGPGRDKLMLRGLSDGAFTGEARAAVGVYLDEVPLIYKAADPDLRMVDLQRVEVDRGPQGAMFGAGEPGGMVRFVTNKPRLDGFSSTASALWASTRSGGVGHAADAAVNLPLLRDRLALRIVGYEEIQGGYVHQAERGRGTMDRTDRWGGRVAALMRLNDDWRIGVSGVSQRLATGDTHYFNPDTGRRRPARRVRETHLNILDEAEISLEGEGDWGRFWAESAYVGHRYASVYDASRAPQAAGAEPDLAAYLEPTRTRRMINQVRLSFPVTGRLGGLVGIYLADTDRTASPRLRDLDRRRRDFTERRHDRVLDRALYGRLTYAPDDRWTMTVGGRAFQTSGELSSVAVVGPALAERRRRITAAGFAPWLSVEYGLARGGDVYLLYSEAYRPGGLNSPGLGRGRVPAFFGTDRLQNLEGGLQLRSPDGLASLRTGLAYMRWRNFQSDEYTRGGGAFAANVGEARTLALSVEGEARIGDDLSLAGQAQWTTAELIHTPPSSLARPARALSGIPNLSLGGLAEYRRPLTGALSLVVRAEAAYLGPSHLTLDARSPRMGDYLSDRIAAEVTAPHWSAELFVDNVGDTRRNTFAFGNPFTLGRMPQETPQRPRTVGVRMDVAF